MDFFDLYDQDISFWPCHLDFLIPHISTLRAMWLYMPWLISQTQTFTCPFSITTGTLTSKPPLALLRYMVHRGLSFWPCHLDFLIPHISTLRAMWLYMAWLISQTQIFTYPFSITIGTSTPKPPLALLWYMVHRGQALIDTSSITIMIHTTLYVCNELTLIIMINSFSSLKFFLSLWHSRCAIILAITYIFMNEYLQHNHKIFFMFHT
jgi:hypothetical protein